MITDMTISALIVRRGDSWGWGLTDRPPASTTAHSSTSIRAREERKTRGKHAQCGHLQWLSRSAQPTSRTGPPVFSAGADIDQDSWRCRIKRATDSRHQYVSSREEPGPSRRDTGRATACADCTCTVFGGFLLHMDPVDSRRRGVFVEQVMPDRLVYNSFGKILGSEARKSQLRKYLTQKIHEKWQKIVFFVSIRPWTSQLVHSLKKRQIYRSTQNSMGYKMVVKEFWQSTFFCEIHSKYCKRMSFSNLEQNSICTFSPLF